MKKGFSLAELMIVVVIMGILGALAIPNFAHSAAKGRANQAVTYLRLIRTGEKIWFANHASYTTCTAAEIQTKLGVDVSGSNYTFTVPTADATDFSAQAVGEGNTITINAAGSVSGNPYKK